MCYRLAWLLFFLVNVELVVGWVHTCWRDDDHVLFVPPGASRSLHVCGWVIARTVRNNELLDPVAGWC